MVCVSCVVIPFLLWFFNKYIRPIVARFWNPSVEKLECPYKGKTENTEATEQTNQKLGEDGVTVANGHGVNSPVVNGHAVTAGGDDKKNL